jgi:hypothetical protein
MAPTLSRFGNNRDASATKRRYLDIYTGPAVYAAGGDSFVPGDVGFGTIDAIFGKVISNGTAIRIGWYDRTAQKILWIDPLTGAETVAGTDLSGYTGTLEVVGR